MSQLTTLKALLGTSSESDVVLQFYLDDAEAIICDIRNSESVEPQYETHQIKIAIELYNKRGVEGQSAHGENGISRSYERADVSSSLLCQITPMVKAPNTPKRVITP